MIDLHVHSNCSDGTFTPTELVTYALKKVLSAFALTDHDTTDGIDEAMQAAEGQPVSVIPGIEFSTNYEGKDLHIVGLFIDKEHPVFRARLAEFLASRKKRNIEMCRRLREIGGIDIDYDTLRALYPDSVLTRAHYADYLMKHHYVGDKKEAFDRYVGDHCSCYVPREKVSPEDVVALLKETGAISVLAHPTLYHMSDARLETLVSHLKEVGLDGMETIYSTYTEGETRQMKSLAKKYDLLESGGSDFHGANKPTIDLAIGKGHLAVPDSVLEKIEAARAIKLT